jgi:hypothetical protein
VYRGGLSKCRLHVSVVARSAVEFWVIKVKKFSSVTGSELLSRNYNNYENDVISTHN